MIKVEIAGEGTVVHNDKIMIDGQDISRHVTGYKTEAYVGEMRKVKLFVIHDGPFKIDADVDDVIIEINGTEYHLTKE
jgi:hypothetical protein